jgi:putative peptidoglycan lipid II flippase
VAVLYFAYRLIQFPIGIFSNALSQAILPTFSTQALQQDYKNLSQSFSFALRMLFFLMLPVSVAFMVLAKPIIWALFGGGRFDTYCTQATAGVLFFYSIGLTAYGAVKIMQSCFFALKDTVTPTKISFLALVINVVFNAILMFPLKLNGLALATSISGIISSVVLFIILKKRLGLIQAGSIFKSFIRIFAASLCMGVVCYFLSRNSLISTSGLSARVINLGIPILSGLVSYFIFCFIFRVDEIEELLLWLHQGKKD